MGNRNTVAIARCAIEIDSIRVHLRLSAVSDFLIDFSLSNPWWTPRTMNANDSAGGGRRGMRG
jgi:hypothetical protein